MISIPNIVKHRLHVWPQDLVDRSGTPPAAAKEQAELGRELWEAASQGKAAGVRLLLGAGADPNTVVRTNQSPAPGHVTRILISDWLRCGRASCPPPAPW